MACCLSDCLPEAHCDKRSTLISPSFICLVPRSLSSFRGPGRLHWTLAYRNSSSQGVKEEPCPFRHHPHSHCSRLTVTHLIGNDTGSYSCSYTKDGSAHTISTYVFVRGETCKEHVYLFSLLETSEYIEKKQDNGVLRKKQG